MANLQLCSASSAFLASHCDRVREISIMSPCFCLCYVFSVMGIENCHTLDVETIDEGTGERERERFVLEWSWTIKWGNFVILLKFRKFKDFCKIMSYLKKGRAFSEMGQAFIKIY